MTDRKFQRKVRKLMVQGLDKRDAIQRATENLVRDYDQMARNTEIVKSLIRISQELGQVTIPK
jgi:hypothetical protein